MGVQILEIAGRKMAVLPLDDYERLLETAEDREDIAAAIEAERRRKDGVEYLPAGMVDRILDGENALRVWREYRGMTIAELAEKSGYGISMISKIETGSRQGTVSLWKAVAAALGVLPDDIMPVD
ncbi:helix-turn-helix domain-containing protein [Novosphingobium lentum]|uniref:helix-turn-helix domain-containing protein n=1 Tax=Novosphingobium lentum TaxID=145287 RepID=UPI000834719A|nr:helix-turn-helix transcriptional regulator [Novosphingobium lentum]